MLIEGGARAPETGIREHNSMGLPSKDPMAWPGMAPKESNVPTNVPGHPGGSLQRDPQSGLASVLGQWLSPSEPSKYYHFLYVF